VHFKWQQKIDKQISAEDSEENHRGKKAMWRQHDGEIFEMKRKYRRATLLGLAAQVVVILAICLSSGRSEASSQRTSDEGYSTDMKELRDKFNKDKGNVRLLLLLSPTCPECLRGAFEIQNKVLEKIKDSDARVYVVYLPILKRDREGNVPSAMKQLPDKRVSFFWDRNGELAHSYSRVLRLPARQPAWDIYLLFNRDDAWKADVPAPDYWMAQLSGISSERRLDGNKFADETSKLLRINRE
jgi:hypothetical protein